MDAKRTMSGYKKFDLIAIPEDIPEVGVKAGDEGAVVDIFPDGTLVVEVVDEDGYTIDMFNVTADPKPRLVGRWHLGEK